MVKKISIGVLILLLTLVLITWYGPRPDAPALNGTLPVVTLPLEELEEQIKRREAAVEGLKPDNEARIVWADEGRKEKTPYSIVYLHGFGASQGEGAPLHTMLARRFGCNLYLPRFRDHGIESEQAFKGLTAENYLASAKEAVAVGQALGDKVILIGTSTGATLAMFIAAENPDIAAVITYGPLIDLYSEMLFLSRGPWGLQLTRWHQGNPSIIEREGLDRQYWSRLYHAEGMVALSVLVGQTMVPETFRKITCPFFLGYYYKDETEQDRVISIPRMLEMYDHLGTPDLLKRKVTFPDAGNHVIGSHIRSAHWPRVMEATDSFMREILHLEPVDP